VRHGACEALALSAFIGGKIIFAANRKGAARKPDEPTWSVIASIPTKVTSIR